MIKPFRELLAGLHAYWRAHRLIVRHRLWPYLAIPGLLSVAYAALLVVLGVAYFGPFSDHLIENMLPDFMRSEAATLITSILLWLVWLLIGYMTYRHIALILFAPFLGYLSERTETLVTGKPAPTFSSRQMLRDLGRGLVINLRLLLLTVVFSLPAWLLVLVPVAGAIAASAILFWIQAYYGGFGLVDYTLERKRLPVRASIAHVRKHRSRVAGVGIGFLGLLFIPVVGWFLAPAYGAVAGTLATLDTLDA